MEIYDFIDELAGILMNKNCVYVPHVHLEDQEVFVVASKTRTCFEMLDLEFWGMFRLVRHIPQFSFKRVDGLKLMESEDAWFRVRGGEHHFHKLDMAKGFLFQRSLVEKLSICRALKLSKSPDKSRSGKWRSETQRKVTISSSAPGLRGYSW